MHLWLKILSIAGNYFLTPFGQHENPALKKPVISWIDELLKFFTSSGDRQCWSARPCALIETIDSPRKQRLEYTVGLSQHGLELVMLETFHKLREFDILMALCLQIQKYEIGFNRQRLSTSETYLYTPIVHIISNQTSLFTSDSALIIHQQVNSLVGRWQTCAGRSKPHITIYSLCANPTFRNSV